MADYYVIAVHRPEIGLEVIRTTSRKLYKDLMCLLEPFKPVSLIAFVTSIAPLEGSHYTGKEYKEVIESDEFVRSLADKTK